MQAQTQILSWKPRDQTRHCFRDGSAANRGFAKPPGKNHLPFRLRNPPKRTACRRAAATLYSTVRCRQFHWRSAKEPHGENLSVQSTPRLFTANSLPKRIASPEAIRFDRQVSNQRCDLPSGAVRPRRKVYLPTRTKLSSLSLLLCARHHPLTPNGPRLPAEDTAQLLPPLPRGHLLALYLGHAPRLLRLKHPADRRAPLDQERLQQPFLR